MSLWRRDRERARSLHEGKVGAERRNCARALGNEEVRQTPLFCVCESPPAGSPLGALRLIALHGRALLVSTSRRRTFWSVPMSACGGPENAQALMGDAGAVAAWVDDAMGMESWTRLSARSATDGRQGGAGWRALMTGSAAQHPGAGRAFFFFCSLAGLPVGAVRVRWAAVAAQARQTGAGMHAGRSTGTEEEWAQPVSRGDAGPHQASRCCWRSAATLMTGVINHD